MSNKFDEEKLKVLEKLQSALLNCKRCGAPFVKMHPKQIYCSYACQNRASVSKFRKRNTEQVREYLREYQKRPVVRARLNLQARKRYEKNPEPIRESVLKYVRSPKGKTTAHNYYERHKEEILKKRHQVYVKTGK